MTTEKPRGLFPRMGAALFGQRTARLSETLGSTHWLLYLLVITSSVTSVLVLGHSQIPLLFSADWGVRAIVAAAFFVLVATVYAADLCFLKTMQRIPALARNRETTMQLEHMLYMLFVLCVECGTYGVVIYTLDRNPHALLDAAPLLPTTGAIFLAIIGGRVFLLGWTLIQLSIVSRKLPPQLTTLMGTGREIVGAHVERGLAGLDLAHMTLAGLFRVYAAMSRPPRRVPWGWGFLGNRWLVKREAHRENEEERQAKLVLAALRDISEAQHEPYRSPDVTDEALDEAYTAESAPPYTGTLPELVSPLGVGRVPLNPHPTNGGTPAAATVPTYAGLDDDTFPPTCEWESAAEARQEAPSRELAVTFDAGDMTTEERARMAGLLARGYVLLNANPLMTKRQLREALNVRRETSNEVYNHWLFNGGAAKIEQARAESATITAGKVAQ
jgi:hypothetical protein